MIVPQGARRAIDWFQGFLDLGLLESKSGCRILEKLNVTCQNRPVLPVSIPLPVQRNRQGITFFRRKISTSLSRRCLRDSSAETSSTAGLTSGGGKAGRV